MSWKHPLKSEKINIRSLLKKMGWQQWAALLILGLLLAVLSLPTAKEEPKDTQASFWESGEEQETLGSDLEKKLESILEKVEGVGRVQVLLMTGQEKDAMGFDTGEGTKVTGVLIAAVGADNSVTVQNIQQAVMALFQIDAHKIKVMKMK